MAGVRTARITSGGAFPPFNLFAVLRGDPAGAGGTPAGITISRTFPGLEPHCAQLVIQSDPDNGATKLYMGMDSNVSATDAGLQLNAGASYTWNSVDKNAVALNRWLKTDAAGDILITMEEY